MPKLDIPSACPVCEKKIDAVTRPDENGAVPSPGDISICFYCATVSRFDDNLKLEQLTNEQFAELPEEVRVSVRKMRDNLLDFNIKRGFIA